MKKVCRRPDFFMKENTTGLQASLIKQNAL